LNSPPSIHTAAASAAVWIDGGDRPVAGAALDLLVRAAAARPQPEPDLGEHLAGTHRRHVGADVEVLHPDHPLGARSADDDLRPGGSADGRQVLGRVGLAQRAAERPAVAHDRVGDHLLGVAEERVVLGDQLGLQQVDVPRQRPDPDLAFLLADVGELVELVDVDQVLRVGQAELHHRQQAVTARDDARLGAEPLERFDRALHARRTLILECCRGLHRVLLSCRQRLA